MYNSLKILYWPEGNLSFSMQSAMHLQYVCPVYIHKVTAILHDNLQRESHKLYDPPTTVTW